MSNEILKVILVTVFLIFWTVFALFGQLFGMAELGIIDKFYSFGSFGPYLLLFNAFGSGVLFLLLWRYLKTR